MKELTIETGLETYNLNGRVEVAFNPTSADFLKKLYAAFDALDGKQEAYQAELGKLEGAALFSVAERMDGSMRELINGVFDKDVCTPLFGGMSVYALAGGVPVWANLMLTVLDECDSAYAREQKASNPRLQKYLAKYGKK